jgi:hypothetical protein
LRSTNAAGWRLRRPGLCRVLADGGNLHECAFELQPGHRPVDLPLWVESRQTLIYLAGIVDVLAYGFDVVQPGIFLVGEQKLGDRSYGAVDRVALGGLLRVFGLRCFSRAEENQWVGQRLGGRGGAALFRAALRQRVSARHAAQKNGQRQVQQPWSHWRSLLFA